MKMIELAILVAVLCFPAFGSSSLDTDTIVDEELPATIYGERPTTAAPDSTTTAPRAIPCSGIPCGYTIFQVSTTVSESFVKNDCECETGTRCYLNALQGSAYVYRCSQFGNETDPVINQATVPVEFPAQTGSRILRRISIDDQ
ncbi:uncharacterized protein LOC118196330 [Stegodyphus dumicola]|uniref:uncharacterized protein LOC118196330 n=1 Tax=Stegodyphus dumicola TaxID=202533 RepID=UPI0015AF1699|nr:uncharacterized protein LOC118196330 [Stegodyphus dumicola]